MQSSTLGTHCAPRAYVPLVRPRTADFSGSQHGVPNNDEEDELVLVAVMAPGQRWKWRVPLPPADEPAAGGDGERGGEQGATTSMQLTPGALVAQWQGLAIPYWHVEAAARCLMQLATAQHYRVPALSCLPPCSCTA